MSVVVQTQDAGTAADEEKPPLLSYEITTIPSPLKASPQNADEPEEVGEIFISVSRQSGTPADVEWIRVKIPAGPMAPDLTTDLAKIIPKIHLTGWSVQLDAAAKEFVFSPTGSHAPIGPETGFTLQFSEIPMSRKVGTAPVTVTESSREGNAEFKDRKTVFNLGKFPADFYLKDFLCEPSIIENGGDVLLTWERSTNATYELLYPGFAADVTQRTSFPLEGVKADTTFYIRGTTGDPTNPVVRILSAQVSVRRPDLDVGSVTVNGALRTKTEADLSQGRLHLFGETLYVGTGNLTPATSWHYEFPCDGFFSVNNTLTETHLFRGPSGAHFAYSFTDDGSTHFVKKSWRIEIEAPTGGHATLSYWPLGTPA